MEDTFAIKVEGVSKKFEIGKEKEATLRGTLAGLIKTKRSSKDEFWALQDLSFEIKKGEVIGIIGKNGAGKSTLLKILSQITKPSTGRITIDGRVASLLEVGTGFHPELTGRENIFLNGTILGMTRKEVKAKFDEIVEFSGIKKFIDTPVKHYSSGMYVRLAFAVAAHLEPEILIIDEVLAVGDAEFQKKCLGKMKQVAGAGRTVLFVSHNLTAVKSLCDSGIYLSQGQLVYKGDISECIDKYLSSTEQNFRSLTNKENAITQINIIEKSTLSPTHDLYLDKDKIFELQIEVKIQDKNNPKLGFTIFNDEHIGIFSGLSSDEKLDLNEGMNSFKIEIPFHLLNTGKYYIEGAIFNNYEILYENDNLMSFNCYATGDNALRNQKSKGIIRLSNNWTTN